MMHDGMPYDLIRGEGHGDSEVPKIALFLGLSPPSFTMGAGN